MQLRYGVNQGIELTFGAESLLAVGGIPSAPAISDPFNAVCHALREPLGYPSLHQLVVPGDRVAIPLEDGVPQRLPLIAGVIGVLQEAGVELSNITVMRTRRDAQLTRRSCLEGLAGGARRSVRELVHEPEEVGSLSYLATTSQGHGLYLNRALCDADLVIPLGIARSARAVDNYGVHGGWFPAYADSATRRRFYRATAVGSHPSHDMQEIHEAAWLLGAQFTVQVVPGGGDRVLHVLAGHMEHVAEAGQRLARRAWEFTVEAPVSLVVAGLSGPRSQQTWQNLGRTLSAALPVVQAGGAIALCTRLHARPGRALRTLARTADDEPMQTPVGDSADTFSAQWLARATEQGRVYLLSELDEDLVESLRMVYVAEPAEIQRLVQRHASCAVMHHGQFAIPLLLAGGDPR